MILNDQQIEDLCTNGHDLISPFQQKNLSNCSYLLHAETVFLSETGFTAPIVPEGPQLVWTIKPGEALIVLIEETVHLPAKLLGMYTQLNRWAGKGLSLMNASLVEPYYHGPLSCQLVNFSKEPLYLPQGAPIAKLTFHTLENAPARPRPESLLRPEYRNMLAESAARNPVSFLNIAAIRQELKDVARQEASNTTNATLRNGSLVLAMLLLFATLQPWLSDMFAKRSGYLIDSSTKEVAELRDELKREGAGAYSERLSKQVESLSAKLDAQVKERQADSARIQQLQQTVKGLRK